MKKIAALIVIIVSILSISTVYATSTRVMTNQTSSQLVEIKDKELKEIEDYKQAYGSDTYGMTAYMLNKVRIYSVPFCFVGVALAAIYQYVIGVKRIDVRDKGFFLMISIVTVFVICQVLPLIFAIVVKSWRG